MIDRYNDQLPVGLLVQLVEHYTRNTETCGPFLESPEKPFLKLRLAHSVKLVFSHVVKGRKFKITAKFRALRRLRFENTKRTMSPEMRPKSFGTFEKRTPDL